MAPTYPSISKPSIINLKLLLPFEEILLLTNGLLLTENLAQQVIEAGVTRIWISVDGREEINDSIRGVKGYFKNAISVLEVLSALRQKNIPI